MGIDITLQGQERDENFRMEHVSQAPFQSVIKQKTSFDPSVKGWGTYYGQSEPMDANPMNIGPNMVSRVSSDPYCSK